MSFNKQDDSSKKGMYNPTNPMKTSEYGNKGQQQTGKPQQGTMQPGRDNNAKTGGGYVKPGSQQNPGKQGGYDATKKTMPFSGNPDKR